MTMRRSGMTEKKEVHGTISSLPGAIVIAGLTGNLLTGNLEGERCPIGVGHDKEVWEHKWRSLYFVNIMIHKTSAYSTFSNKLSSIFIIWINEPFIDHWS